MADIPLGPVGPPMMCDVCGTRLNSFESWKGGKLQRITWEHTGLFPEGVEDHEPVPVLLDPNVLPRAGFCDFDGAPDPEWCYPCAPFQMPDILVRPNEAGGIDSLGWGSADHWAACEQCHADIEAGRWESVEKRYLSHKVVPKMIRAELRGPLRALHREFRLHRLGPPFLVRRGES